MNRIRYVLFEQPIEANRQLSPFCGVYLSILPLVIVSRNIAKVVNSTLADTVSVLCIYVSAAALYKMLLNQLFFSHFVRCTKYISTLLFSYMVVVSKRNVGQRLVAQLIDEQCFTTDSVLDLKFMGCASSVHVLHYSSS